jgi:hypothetical protein
MEPGGWIFLAIFGFIIGVIIVKRIEEYKENKKNKK